jgi:hypothetical protein
MFLRDDGFAITGFLFQECELIYICEEFWKWLEGFDWRRSWNGYMALLDYENSEMIEEVVEGNVFSFYESVVWKKCIIKSSVFFLHSRPIIIK